MNDFMTPENLATFTGLVTAVGIIVQFSKSLVKKQFDDYAVRIYAFLISLVLSFIFMPNGYDAKGIALTVINAIIVTLTAVGGYEIITNPKAKKKI